MASHALHTEQKNRLRRIFPVAFTVIAGTTLTAIAFAIIQGLERERIQMDFESIAANQARSINERIQSYENLLHTLRSLFVASENVSRAEFELVCDGLRARQPGAGEFRWLPFVREADRSAAERDARTETNTDWTIKEHSPPPDGELKPAEARAHYLPVLYISPNAENVDQLGIDEFQGSHQRALQRAIETGKAAATRRVGFQSISGTEFGWITYLGVYENGADPASIEQGWAKLKGVVEGEFRLNEVLVGNADLNQALDLVLTDDTPGTTEPYLLNFSRGNLRSIPPPHAADLKHPMRLEYPIPTAGRLWKLHVQPNASWMATKRTGFPFVVLGFGLWLTAFLATSIHSSRRQAETVSRLVDTRTAQLRAVEEQLREDIHQRNQAEQRYQAFVQQSTEAIWRFELDEPMPIDWPEERQLEFIYQHAYLAECNDACARMYGYDRFDEMLGMRLSKLMPISDPLNQEHLLMFIRSGYQLAEWESHELDRFGNEHVFLNNATGIVENGKFVRGWGTQRDITEQHRFEKERLAAAERLRVAIEAVHLGLWEWDLTTGNLLWNDELFEIYGVSRQEFVPNYERFVNAIHPMDREHVEQAVNRALADPSETYESEFRIIRPDETERWIHTRAYVRRDSSAKAIGMLGAAIDITSRKETEVEHAAMERKLQDTQKLESLGILAGGIAHDFNNLLTGVLGNASLARMDLPESSHVQPFLKQIEHSALRAADLCRQMLAYSGKGRFVVQRVNLSHLVEESVALLQVSISKDASLKMNLASPIPPVQADATQLRQILMNLVMNASDAIGEQAGLIEIKTGVIEADRTFLASTHLSPILPPGPYVFLEVRDTGSGMDPETQKRIFDPFFTTKFTGRGLGLAAVLGIVRGHQGAMKVSSKPGRGSTFTLLLPKVEGEAENISFSHFRTAAWRGSGRVLVIDDEEVVRRVATQMLKSMGLECVAATDGRQGLDLFAAHPRAFDVVLLDLTMPKMDGAETFVELRRLQQSIPIILMSGYSEQDAVSKLGHQDMAGFVQKPIQRDELQHILQRTIEAAKEAGRGI